MSVLLSPLLRVDFPGGIARICDGAFVKWGADIYLSSDPIWGHVADVGSLEEGTGDEIPGFSFTLQPNAATSWATLKNPAIKGSAVALHLAELDAETHAIIGTPEPLFNGFIAGLSVTTGRDGDQAFRRLEFLVVSEGERLFGTNEGNRLDPNFHKRIWPGELGEDAATGLVTPVAWGTGSPPSTAPNQNSYNPGQVRGGFFR